MQRRLSFLPVFSTLSVLVFFAAAMFLLDTRYTAFLGVDALYHVQHARLLAAHGGFTYLAPWFPQHFFSIHPVDPYALHHFLLAKFLSFGGDPILSTKLFAAILSGGVFAAMYSILRHAAVRVPLLWTIFAALSSTGFIFRLLLDRPFTVGILLYSIGTYLLVQKKYVWVTLLMIPYVLMYNLAPMLLFPAILTMFIRGWITQEWSLWPIIAVLSGLSIGLLLHPQTISYILLIKAHLYDIFVLQLQGVPLPIGAEIVPQSPENTLRLLSIPILLLVLASTALLTNIYTPRTTHSRVLVYTLLLHSTVWFPITLGIHRGIEYWYPLTWILIAVIFDSVWQTYSRTMHGTLRTFILGSALFAISSVGAATYALFIPSVLTAGTMQDIRVEELGAVASYIQDTKDTIWYSDWWMFTALFYSLDHPDTYRYVGGYDPVFQYLYNSDTYFSWYNLREDGIHCFSRTDCPETLTSSALLTGVFDSSVAIVQTNPTAAIYMTLEQDDHFSKQDIGAYTIFYLDNTAER